jgi:hypothetical protein
MIVIYLLYELKKERVGYLCNKQYFALLSFNFYLKFTQHEAYCFCLFTDIQHQLCSIR